MPNILGKAINDVQGESIAQLRRRVKTKIVRQHKGFGYYPYWWTVTLTNPYKFDSGGTFFRWSAVREAKRAAKRLKKVERPDEVILEEDQPS